jgi:ketopantoate reductase
MFNQVQNGVQKDETLLKFLPRPSVMGGVSYISAAIQEPGVIRHFGPIQKLVFGEFDGQHSQRALDLLRACESAGIGASVSTDIELEIWEKFVFLVGLSATTATIRQPIGVIRTNPQTRGFLLDVMRETVNVGRSRGVALPEDHVINSIFDRPRRVQGCRSRLYCEGLLYPVVLPGLQRFHSARATPADLGEGDPDTSKLSSRRLRHGAIRINSRSMRA